MSTADEQPPFSPVPLAIIGMGCLFPKADSTEAFWANIKGGVDAVSDIPATHWRPEEHFNSDPAAPDKTYAKRGAFLEPVDFNPLEFGISPNNIEATDTTQLLGMLVAQQALRDAGYATGKDSNDGRPFNRERTSVILGVTGALELVIPLGARLGRPIWRKALADAGVAKPQADEVVQRIADSYVPWQENSFPGLLGNVAAGRIANRFDTGGTNCVVDAACASSLGAIHLAAMELYAGRSEMAITGGIDTFNDIFMYMCFSKTPALSPTGNSRPFAAGGDGTILGEGLGVVVLKRLADAQRDGDKIYAVIRSIGSSSDGKGNAVYAPSADGQIRCLLSAYREAGISPRTIELVEAHGTGTKVGDAVEAKALAEVFRTDRGEGTWCALGSVKSMIGHTKAAAGVAGLIKTALALDHKVLPPTIKVDRPLDVIEPGKAPVYVNTEKRPWLPRAEHPRRAGVSAFGFGGSNFHCVLEEAQAVKTGVDWDDRVLLLPFGAESREQLSRDLAAFAADQSWNQLRRAAANLCRGFSPDAACRVVIVAQKNASDLAKLLESARRMLAQHPQRQTWSTPDGVYFGAGHPGKLGVLFPGQGSQYVGMLRDLACQFPQMLDTLAEADAAFGKTEHGQRLSDHIYPIPVFTDQARAANELALGDTRVAQPALGAVSLGAWRVLTEFGISPDAAAGHSYGELVALCAAGRMDAAALHQLSRIRGQAMADAAQGAAADRGAMLAVAAAVGDIQQLIESEHWKLVIANKNAPQQVVLSGATSQIERAAAVLESRGIRNRRLAVSAAFHSPLVAAAQKPFAAALKDISLLPGQMPVFANSTADVYPADSSAAADLLAGQLAQSVEFIGEIEKMYGSDVRTFVEVGPAGKLSGLVRAILHDREHTVVALDASAGKRSGIYDLGCALGQLAACGYGVALTRWDASFAQRAIEPEPKKPAMTVRLSGANYVKPREKSAARPPAVAGPVSPVRELEQKGSIRLNPPPEKLSGPSASSNGAAGAPPVTVAAPASGLAQALQATQQSILALQKMQEQTAQLHQQYLLGQEQAQRTLHQLVEQQMRLLGASCGVALPAPVVEVPRAAAEMPVVEMAKPVVRQAAATDNGAVPLAAVPKPTEAAPVVAVVARVSDDRAAKILLEVVADKTGYPVEMLELDMSLDTDLGIDSIKRVEILSALQIRMPEAPVVKPEDLGRLQTLRQIVAFLDQNAATPAPAAPGPPQKTTAAAAADGEARKVLLEVVADKTGYPVEMLELDMSLDTDLGIDSIKRVEILSALQTRMPEAPVVRPEDLGRLQTLRQIVAFLEDGKAPPAVVHAVPANGPAGKVMAGAEASSTVGNGRHAPRELLDRRVLTVVPLGSAAERASLHLPKDSQVWITDDGGGLAAKICTVLKGRELDARIVDLDTAPGHAHVAGLLILAPAHPAQGFIQSAFKLVQRVGPALRKAGRQADAFLAGASLLDGSFALNGHTPRSPITGGLAGLVKTAGHEWPEVSCKSLDLSDELSDLDVRAAAIAEELLLKGPMEVGISQSGRVETRLVSKALNGEVGKAPLTPRDVVVVTGGARGVTAAVSLALAKQYGCKLLLLGRSPAPTPEPEWLAGIAGETQLKRALAARMQGVISPKALEEQYRRAMANRQVLSTLGQIEATGAQAIYRSLDVRDAAAVAAAIDDARQNLGPIRGIIHGAGVLQDRLIEQKTSAQFDEVFSTKVDGFAALLSAVEQDDLKVIVAFSSSTGRFGRKGQVAYAAANEVLNKLAQQQAHQRPRCRVLSMNWGPWEGGMVTPELRRVFEDEGVGLIPLEAGADYLVREMSTPAGGPVEIVILGPEPGVTAEPVVTAEADASMSVAFERELDLESCPFLRSHVIKGHAVLPAAMIIEWLAHGAMHDNPGLLFHGFDDLRIFKGVVLGPDEALPIEVLSGPAIAQDGMELVPVELRSGNTLHARARIVLTTQLPPGQPSAAPGANLPYPASNGDIYSDGRLFHGPELQGIEAVEGWSEEGIIGLAAAAPAPSAWMAKPLRSGWLADPLVLDVSFQLMILWCFEARGVGSLPTRIAGYRQYVRAFPQDPTRIAIRVSQASEHAAQAVIEFIDQAGALVARMDGYECVMDATLNDSFTRNQLAEQV